MNPIVDQPDTGPTDPVLDLARAPDDGPFGPEDWAPVHGRRGRHLPPPGRGGRRLATLAVLAVDALALGLTALGTTGPVRMLLGLAFLLAVPGWAVVGYLRLAWPAAEVSLTVAASLAVTLLGSEVMLWVHAWDPLTLQAVLGATSALLLVGQLLRPRSRLGAVR